MTPAHSIPQAIRRAADLWPEKTWLDFSGERLTFREVDVATNRLARGLAGLGVAKGDRVCSMLDNHPDLVLLWIALAKLGAISVPINTAFRGEFLRHQVADSGAVVIVSDADFAERFVAIEDGLPQARLLVHRGDISLESLRLRLTPFDTLYCGDAAPIKDEVASSDLTLLLYTSGTTGPSKGCMVSHNYICNMGWQSNRYIGITHDDVYWTPCPLFHMGAAGGMIGTLQTGTTMSIFPRFSLSGFWPEIERSGATVVMILSSMLNFVADAPDTEASKRCYGQIRTIHGVPFSASLQTRWKERFGVRNAGAVGYGMTEACSITLTKLEEPAPPGASGQRYEDFDVEVVDDADRMLPQGEVGEVVLRPRNPDVMYQGYWRRPEATIETHRNLWFHTGDIGRFDENGFFYFVDRKKDYLRRGGENISSYEMEVAFRAHPDIEDVAVHAIRSQGSEDEVKVTAILRSGADLTPEALCRWSIDRLPSFAVPRYIEFRGFFPRNGVGRVLKFQLRDEGVTPGTWDRQSSDIVLRRSARRS